jgi:hypothetical protein
MRNLGLAPKYLGIEIEHHPNGIFVDQSTHILISILEESSLLDCNPSTTPLPKKTKLQKDSNASYVDPTNYRSLVGKLIFLTNISPNIYLDVNLASRFM